MCLNIICKTTNFAIKSIGCIIIFIIFYVFVMCILIHIGYDGIWHYHFKLAYYIFNALSR